MNPQLQKIPGGSWSASPLFFHLPPEWRNGEFGPICRSGRARIVRLGCGNCTRGEGEPGPKLEERIVVLTYPRPAAWLPALPFSGSGI